MSDSKDSYLKIFRTTSLFGGIQFFNIIISIIRTKLVAYFIGPEGMGIIALLNSSLGVIGGITNLGIETSAVKHISESYKDNDLKSVSPIVSIIKKIVLLTGIIGALLTVIFASWLSKLTFGNSDHTFSFVFLSITILFKQISSGQLVVLQSLRKMRLLAKANFYGNFFGLLISIPLYYFYKIEAIIPTIIVSSLSALVFSFYYSKKLVFEKNKISIRQVILESNKIVTLGVFLTLSGLLTIVSAYFLQIYIGKNGGLEQVGFYNAAFTLLNSYVGIIFTVMSTDYFPRLSSICNDNQKIRESVVQQAIFSILIITPIIVLFLAFISLIVKIIYAPTFIEIIPMVCFGILAMLFKAVSWSMGYIIIAKGDSKIFIKTAIGFNFISLILNILGYHFYGLEGLGISFLIYYMIHFFVLKIITKKRYNFYFENDFFRVYIICIIICGVTFLLRYVQNIILQYILMAIFIVLSISFALFKLNQKMELITFFKSGCSKK